MVLSDILILSELSSLFAYVHTRSMFQGKNQGKNSITQKQTNSMHSIGSAINMAEREGFEPSVRGYRTPDFESGTFDHSATSPKAANSTSKRRFRAECWHA